MPPKKKKSVRSRAKDFLAEEEDEKKREEALRLIVERAAQEMKDEPDERDDGEDEKPDPEEKPKRKAPTLAQTAATIVAGAAASQATGTKMPRRRGMSAWNVGQAIAGAWGVNKLLTAEVKKQLGKAAISELEAAGETLATTVRGIAQRALNLDAIKAQKQTILAEFEPEEEPIVSTPSTPTQSQARAEQARDAVIQERKMDIDEEVPMVNDTAVDMAKTDTKFLETVSDFVNQMPNNTKTARARKTKAMTTAITFAEAIQRGERRSLRNLVQRMRQSRMSQDSIRAVLNTLDNIAEELPEDYDDGVLNEPENKEDGNADVREAIQTAGQALAQRIKDLKKKFPKKEVPAEVKTDVAKLFKALSKKTVDRIQRDGLASLGNIRGFLGTLVAEVGAEAINSIINIAVNNRRNLAAAVTNSAIQAIPADGIGRVVNATTGAAAWIIDRSKPVAEIKAGEGEEQPAEEPAMLQLPAPEDVQPQPPQPPEPPPPQEEEDEGEVEFNNNNDDNEAEQEPPEPEEEEKKEEMKDADAGDTRLDNIDTAAAVGIAGVAAAGLAASAGEEKQAEEKQATTTTPISTGAGTGDLRPEFFDVGVNFFNAERDQLLKDGSNWAAFNFVGDPLNEHGNNPIVQENHFNDLLRFSGSLFMPSYVPPTQPPTLESVLQTSSEFQDVLQINQSFSDVFDKAGSRPMMRVVPENPFFDRDWTNFL